MKNTYKQNVKKACTKVASVLAVPTILLTAFVGLNAVMIPFELAFNGLERAIGAKKNQINATLIKKGNIKTPRSNTYWADFVTTDSDTIRLYDTPDVPSGKIFANTQVIKAKTGQNYEITYLDGPLSKKIIDIK